MDIVAFVIFLIGLSFIEIMLLMEGTISYPYFWFCVCFNLVVFITYIVMIRKIRASYRKNRINCMYE